MKNKALLLIVLALMPALRMNLYAQDAPWNIYIGVPIGTATKTVFNDD